MSKSPIKTVAALAGLVVALFVTTLAPARAEAVVRIAMTAGDIPDWTGQPDQGFEGYRFVGFNLYEGLVNWDLSKAGVEVRLKPGLATKWSVDPDNHNKWVVELRPDVKFHDGCAWNADVALWNFDRLMSDKSRAFSPAHFARARSRTNDIDHVEKIDGMTIAIYTKRVTSLMPYNLPFVLMMSKCAMEKAGNDYQVYANAPSGTGPYRFDKVVPHERLELVKNSDYWDPNRLPKHDRVVLLPMPEATTRAAALLTGQVDMIEAPSPDMIPRLKSAGMIVITHPYPHIWPYLLNFQRGPFMDLRVRQAANYAINRDEVVEMLGGVAIPSYASYTPYQRNYGHPFEYKWNPDKATALLKEANCYPCSVMIAISTSGSGQMQPLPMNELVKAQLEAVGFAVKFDVLDWNTVLDVFIKGWQKYPQYDGVNFSNGVTDPLAGIVKPFTTANRTPLGPNWGWYENKEIDALADQVLNSFDESEQDKLLTKIHEISTKDAVRVFIVSDLNPRALSPRLKGFVQVQSWFQDITPIMVQGATN